MLARKEMQFGIGQENSRAQQVLTVDFLALHEHMQSCAAASDVRFQVRSCAEAALRFAQRRIISCVFLFLLMAAMFVSW